MSEAALGGYCAVAKYSLSARIWRALGFRMAYVHTPEEWSKESPDWAIGGLTTDTFISVSIADRLRILLTGKAMMQIKTRTDKEVVHAQSISDFAVMPLGRQHR